MASASIRFNKAAANRCGSPPRFPRKGTLFDPRFNKAAANRCGSPAKAVKKMAKKAVLQ